jgi:hypothetical protein
MKTIYSITRILSIIILLAVTSCDENKFLEEQPLSIYTADNSLVTSSDFQAAVNELYRDVRYLLYEPEFWIRKR